jgi:hypothetical protein
MTALTELKDQGWSGGIETAGDTWKLVLRRDGKNTVNAELGQWLVLDGDLRAMSPADFQDHGYTSDPVVEFPALAEPVVEEVPVDAEPFGATSPDTAVKAVR